MIIQVIKHCGCLSSNIEWHGVVVISDMTALSAFLCFLSPKLRAVVARRQTATSQSHFRTSMQPYSWCSTWHKPRRPKKNLMALTSLHVASGSVQRWRLQLHWLLLSTSSPVGMYQTFVCVCSMDGQTVTELPPHRTKTTDPPRRKGQPRTWMTWRRKCPLWVKPPWPDLCFNVLVELLLNFSFSPCECKSV